MTGESTPESVSVSELSFSYRICSLMLFFLQTLKTEALL